MSEPLYNLIVAGHPEEEQISSITSTINDAISPFGLNIGNEFIITIIKDEEFIPSQKSSSCAIFFGGGTKRQPNIESLMINGISVIPVISQINSVAQELPLALQVLNCFSYVGDGPQRLTTTILECLGLLPKQRKVFVSYRRNESRNAALQLFDVFSHHQYEVFLDTHSIKPGEVFQSTLWHNLCDCDVMVMLDTQNYFDSRWTSAEFGRALAKGISILRVGWPNVPISKKLQTALDIQLEHVDLNIESGHISETKTANICRSVEILRSKSHAVRKLNLFSNIQKSVALIGGEILSVGANMTIYAELHGKQRLTITPHVGIPTSYSLHDAIDKSSNSKAVIVYDEVGLDEKLKEHLSWLDRQIENGHYVKASNVAWDLADLEDKQ
ncbi:toll/interleukin-1 receptor domain-containing protein [Aeromonas veronii]|uniref:toll/interleukin-1 receptor domain-containing protein n=1 Tax=Aeromonas TaxID=642 RepID=UPI001F372A1C|nr:toll/interleukin-1 receptor domain-containing protein [Aeromonas veronii]MCF5894762.1 toll/interleukin-1 receptor domain-containing protein [Aeromonas veronii]